MTKVNPHIFRGYDIRGVAGKDLTPEVMELIGKGYGTFLAQRRVREAVVGGSCRESTPVLKPAFIKGLTSTGVDVIDLGLTMTQSVYFAHYHFKTIGGANITASHNPREYNGVKLGLGFSSTLVTEEILELRDIIDKGAFAVGEGKVTRGEWQEAYQADLLKRINIKRSFKVVVDSVNGSTGPFVPAILREAGVEVIEQNTTPDGTFPSGTPDPTEEEVLHRLAKSVQAAGADMGFAFDEDGDRLGVVDGRGRMIWNDVLVALFAKDILSYLPGATIVYNTLCSKLVTDVIRSNGGNALMWKTGHSFIKAKIREERAPFGGELSGHFFFVDNFYGHDDGAFTALRLLEFLSNQEQSLAEILDDLPQYISSPEIKLGCGDDVKWAVIDRLAAQFRESYPEGEFVDIDGIRVDYPGWMAIIRASQNGPYITVKFEARENSRYNELKKELHTLLESHNEIDFAAGVNLKAMLE